jgi:hypothetical protein
MLISKIELIFRKVLRCAIKHHHRYLTSFSAVLGSLPQLNVVLVEGDRCLVVENFLNVLVGGLVGSGLRSRCRTAKALQDGCAIRGNASVMELYLW